MHFTLVVFYPHKNTHTHTDPHTHIQCIVRFRCPCVRVSFGIAYFWGAAIPLPSPAHLLRVFRFRNWLFPMICWQITLRCCRLSLASLCHFHPPPRCQIHFQNKHLGYVCMGMSMSLCGRMAGCVSVCVWEQQVLPTNLKVLLSPSPERK